MPGRIYAIGCKCGHTIVVKGPEVSGGVRNGPTGELPEDPFAAFYGKYQLPPMQAARPPAGASARGATSSASRPAAPSAFPGRQTGSVSPPPVAIEPAPPPFDPIAASHGLLLDVDHARALSGGSLATDSLPLPEVEDRDEVSITFSDRLTLRGGESPRPWLLVAATVLAVLVLAGGAFAVLSRRTASPPAVAETAPVQPPTVATPPPPSNAAPAPQAQQAPIAAAPAPAPVATVPVPSAVPGSRTPVQGPRLARPVRRAPPVVAEEPIPGSSARPGDASSSPALLDLLSRKEDAPAASSTPEPEARGAGAGAGVPGIAEVQALVQRNRSGFDACVEGAGPDAHLAGRKVMLSVTVNPSGIVTSPRLDDPLLDGSAAGVCLKSAARKLVASPFSGEAVRVRVPLTLGP